MQNRKFTLLFILVNLIFTSLFSQTSTITYSGSGMSTSVCNVFNIGYTLGGFLHLPTAGGASFDGTYVKCSAQWGSTTTSNYGTIYSIKYPFKKGNTYTVKIRGKSSSTTENVTVTASLNTQNFNTNTNTLCGAVAESNWTAVETNAYGFITLNPAEAQQTFTSTTPSNSYDYLSIIVTGPISGNPIIGMIKDVVIVETPAPSTSFSISPASVTKACGTGLNQTFTISGVNIPGGASVSYSWDLGSSSSGWYYGGSPASQNISTGSSNTITLTDVACAAKPTNITAKATISSTDYPAGTVTVSSAPFIIDGPRYVCTSSTSSGYTITNLSGSCSPSVSWSFSNGNVSVDNPSSTSTTLTYSSSGDGILTASYSSGCGSGTLTMPVTAGSPIPQGISNYLTNYGHGNSPTLVSQYAFLGTNHSQPGDNGGSFNYTVNDPLFSGLSWSVVSQPSGTNYQIVDNTTWMYVTMNGCVNCSLGITMNLSGTGPCGSYSQNISSTLARISGFPFRASMFPNPATSSTTVSLEVVEDNTLSTAERAQALAASKPLIRIIQISSQMGIILKTFEYKAGVSSIKIPLNGLASGIYKLSVFDGTNWSSQQLIIK